MPDNCTADDACDFCIKIISETFDYAAAYKPNSAFFEYFGSKGFEALQKVIEAIPTDIPIILDSKRGDIDTTAQVCRIVFPNFEIFVFFNWLGLCLFFI